MLDEEMDHMIRDAAANHHPVYNDKAWEMMEKKLDKHLPQKRDGRKYIFILFLFLLLGGGALVTVYQLNRDKATPPGSLAGQNINKDMAGKNLPPGQDNNTTAPGSVSDAAEANSASEIVKGPVSKTDETVLKQPPGNTVSNNNIGNAVKNKRTVQPGKGRSVMNITAPAMGNGEVVVSGKGQGNKRSPVSKRGTGKKMVTIKAASPETEAENITASVPAKTVKEEISKKETTGQQINQEQKKETADQPANEEQKKEPAEQPVKAEQKKEETVMKAETEKTKEAAQTANKPASSPDKKKTKKDIAGNFGITVSAGPDVSFVSLNRLGKVTMMYGAGLSYHFGKRFTVRTGFYTSDKIYDAAPDQYQAPGGNYPYLYNIAADCKVYEIPLSLSYNFGYGKKHNWFGNVGLSSFLMKSEYYNYQYKTPGGQTYNYARTIKDDNKHYFSVLTLSGGYQYKLSTRVSLQAEPYIKLPLGGVGIGKVKLNSSGILFTATIRPFMKKNK